MIAGHRRGEAPGQVDLVAVAGGDVALDAGEGPPVGDGVQVAGHRPGDPEGLPGRGRGRLGKQGEQRVPVRRGAGIPAGGNQPAPLRLVVHHHRPVVDAHRHFRNAFRVQGADRQALDAPGQVVGKVADGAAGEGQGRRASVRRQDPAQQLEGVGGGQAGVAQGTGTRAANLGHAAPGDQGGIGSRRQDVHAPGGGVGPAAVQEYRPGLVGDGLEQLGAVREIGQGADAAGGRCRVHDGGRDFMG
jgi:hypothetical protein